MRPIVNMPEEDLVTDIANMHKMLAKISRVVPEISSRTDRQTDILITMLRNRSRERSENRYSSVYTVRVIVRAPWSQRGTHAVMICSLFPEKGRHQMHVCIRSIAFELSGLYLDIYFAPVRGAEVL